MAEKRTFWVLSVRTVDGRDLASEEPCGEHERGDDPGPDPDGGAPATRMYSQIRASVCVMVPKKTENRLRFSARLDEGTPQVRFERIV